jgi:hypothetical protein
MSVVIFVFGGPGLGNQRYAKREGEKFSFMDLGLMSRCYSPRANSAVVA